MWIFDETAFHLLVDSNLSLFKARILFKESVATHLNDVWFQAAKQINALLFPVEGWFIHA
jgi:hypothetical protein